MKVIPTPWFTCGTGPGGGEFLGWLFGVIAGGGGVDAWTAVRGGLNIGALIGGGLYPPLALIGVGLYPPLEKAAGGGGL